jgi:hypothetical protein
LGGRGKNELVLFIYSAYSGLSTYLFSSSGVPETLRINQVIVSGPATVHRLPGTDRQMRNVPHQSVTSPK